VKFVSGVIVGLILAILIPALLIVTGVFSMAAASKPTSIEEKAGTWAWLQSAKKHAPKMKNPMPVDAETLDAGLGHYKENCVVCHGAPGVEASEIGKGLNPAAPMLDTKLVQDLSDGELFWTVKNGIRMTGMPAFGPTHTDEEIWKIVTFVRRLGQLTEKEKAALHEATEEEEHHHESDHHNEEHKDEKSKPHVHTHPHEQ